jgi:hypothetical protein
VVLGSESWQGDAETIPGVDGVQAFHGVVTASHASAGAAISLVQGAGSVGHTSSSSSSMMPGVATAHPTTNCMPKTFW